MVDKASGLERIKECERGNWKKLHYEELIDTLMFSQNIIWAI